MRVVGRAAAGGRQRARPQAACAAQQPWRARALAGGWWLVAVHRTHGRGTGSRSRLRRGSQAAGAREQGEEEQTTAKTRQK